jgi:hypothetical protein
MTSPRAAKKVTLLSAEHTFWLCACCRATWNGQPDETPEKCPRCEGPLAALGHGVFKAMVGEFRDGKVNAPFTDQQVMALKSFQTADYIRPLSCERDHGDNDSRLIAKRDGWHCSHCDYRQGWAHLFMFSTWRSESGLWACLDCGGISGGIITGPIGSKRTRAANPLPGDNPRVFRGRTMRERACRCGSRNMVRCEWPRKAAGEYAKALARWAADRAWENRHLAACWKCQPCNAIWMQPPDCDAPTKCPTCEGALKMCENPYKREQVSGGRGQG